MHPRTHRARRATSALCALVCTLLSLASFAMPLSVSAHDLRNARRPSSARTVLHPAPAPRLPLSERRAMALQRVLRAEGVRRCWTRQLYRDPTTPSRRLSVGLSVDGEGRVVQVRVRDPQAPMLASCIATMGTAVPAVGPGEPFEAEASLTFERNE